MNGLEQILQLALLTLSAATAIFAFLQVRSRLRRFDGELYTVAAPPDAGSPEHFFLALHGLLRPPLRRLLFGQPWVSLELVGRAGQVQFQVWIPAGERPFVESLLRAAYPGVELKPAARLRHDVGGREDRDGDGQVGDREAHRTGPGHEHQAHADVRLARGNYLPIQTAFEGEPLASVFWTLARAQGSDTISLQLLVKPKSSTWQTAAHVVAQGLRDGERGLRGALFGIPRDAQPTQLERDRAKAIEDKAAVLAFDCVLRVEATAGRPQQAREFLRSVAASLRPFAAQNSFDFRSVFLVRQFRELFQFRQFPPFGSFILNARELAALWHLPSEAPPQLAVIRAPKLAPPPGVGDGERVIGVTTWADESVPVRLSVADSRHHLALLGATGTGKTTAMLNLAEQDIRAGRGVGILDPKGDLVQGLAGRIPRERIGDVVLITPDEADLTVGINPLEVGPGDDPYLIAENTLTIFKRIYERFWGMRTDDILKSALLTLLRQPNSTLAHIPLLLTDGNFRRRMTADLKDPVGLDSFWQWFERLTEAQRGEAIGPVLNKLRDFLVRPRLRRLLCQPRSTVDLRRVVDGGQILLADLSTGRWGESTAQLIGSFLIAKLWQAVLARSSVSEDKRRDFFLFIDEFQHFQGIAGPFADALAQARSLRLSLTVANQHLGQLPRDLREAISSNARSRVVFQCGQDDAAYLAREFAPLDATALMSLPRFEMAVRLAIGGQTSPAFTARTLPPAAAEDPRRAREVAATSLSRYGRHVAVVDRELQTTLAPMGEPELPAFGVGRRPRR